MQSLRSTLVSLFHFLKEATGRPHIIPEDPHKIFCWNCGETFGTEEIKKNTGCTCSAGTPILRFWTSNDQNFGYFPKNYFILTNKGTQGHIHGDYKAVKMVV